MIETQELTANDLQNVLAVRWITPELGKQACLGRIDSATGAEISGRNGNARYEGILIPNFLPGESRPREYCIRRDYPDIVEEDGEHKIKNKYLSPPGRKNLLYFPPGTNPVWLKDKTLPICWFEGPLKTLAAWRLAWHGLGDAAERPRFLPIGINGVSGWRTVVEKRAGPNGERQDVKGPCPDLNLIEFQDRENIIVFDTNVETKDSVRWARIYFTKELKRRGARIFWPQWPKDTPKSVNGIDDFLAARGPEEGLEMIEAAEDPGDKLHVPFTAPDHWKWLDASTLKDWDVIPMQPIIDGIMAKGNFVFVAAQSQTGKTLFWLWVVLCLCHRRNLFGKYSVTAAKCLYMVLEDPDRRIKERLSDMQHEFPSAIAAGRFVVHVAPGFSIADPAMFEYLEKLITEHGFEVVVIDTYQRATPGISSFRDEDQSLILHKLSNLTRKTGVTLVVVDHVRKDDKAGKRAALTLDDIKGTGGKAQNADCVILMERSGAGRNQIKFQSYSKDFDAPIGILLEVAPKGSKETKFKLIGNLTDLNEANQKKSATTQQMILSNMIEGDWIKSSALQKKAGVSRNTLNRQASAMVKAGLIDETGVGPAKCYKRNCTTEANCADGAVS